MFIPNAFWAKRVDFRINRTYAFQGGQVREDPPVPPIYRETIFRLPAKIGQKMENSIALSHFMSVFPFNVIIHVVFLKNFKNAAAKFPHLTVSDWLWKFV